MNENDGNGEKSRWAKIVDAWLAMQLPHFGGKYSIERMLGLEEYTRNTSLFRVVLVSIGVPLFVFGLVLCQESVPLQNPSDGWEANYGFWVRVGFLGAAIGFTAASEIGPWLDVPGLSLKQTGVYCLLKGFGFIAVGMVVAKLWVFPIPFFVISLSMGMSAMLVGFLRLVIGAHAFSHVLTRKEELGRLNKIGSLHGFLSAAYPVYQILFTHANHTAYELPVLLLLPVFKFIMKKLSTSAAMHKEDLLPHQVVFNVDFFDAFYLATFMQSLSLTTLGALLAVDLVQTTIELRELHERTQHILTRLQDAAGITGNSSQSTNWNLLRAVRSLCYNSKAINSQLRPDIQVRSCLPQRLSPECMELLEKLSIHSQVQLSNDPVRVFNRTIRVVPHNNPVRQQHTKPSSGRGPRTWRGVVVHPLSVRQHPKTADFTPKRMKCKDVISDNTNILHETLELLFTSECLILTEYVETVIPVCYAIFMMVMVHLPSAKYHAEMVGVNQENVGAMVSRMLLYASFELFSFVMLAVITKRNCGINALHQLGFVLETQMPMIISKLILWMVFTLTFRVTHFGPDFSFQFDWIGDQSTSK